MIKKKILLNVLAMLDNKIGLRQGYILASIGKSQQSSNEIRIWGGIDKANMTADVRKLRKNGYLKIRPSEEDRRYSVLQLTTEGKAMLKIISSR